MIFYPVTFLLLLATFVVQEFIPGIPMAHYATLFLPPVFFFAASVAVPFPVMILLAFVAGTLWDARHMPAGAASQAVQSLMTGSDELSATGFGLGISFFLFGVLGMFLQGVMIAALCQGMILGAILQGNMPELTADDVLIITLRPGT